MLDELLPLPRKVEIDAVDVAAPPEVVWAHLRHADLAEAPLIRALFAVRTLPSRLAGHPAESSSVRIDDLCSTPERPGFHLYGDEPPREIAVGAIGKVWQLDIPFEHVPTASAYLAFSTPGFVKVAWSVRLAPIGEAATRVTVEVRVDATDDASWERFERYWVVVGPGSHFIRHALLASLRRRFGGFGADEEARRLPGDDRLGDAQAQITMGKTISAAPEAIWPWLVQMGCRRGGFYSIDALDNGGAASARELHAEWQAIAVGDVFAATPEGEDGFEVLAIDPGRSLVLGGLFDVDAHRQLPFASPRPRRHWHVTWSFTLEPVDGASTRLHVRARAAFSASERWHAAWIRPVHRLMQSSQLEHLAARAEGRLPLDTARDVASGIAGASIMLAAWLTPFLRGARSHWGLSADEARAPRAGDDLVSAPLWQWTHAVEIDAPAGDVWPWVAQIGVGRAGFYSYQWLENVAGCGVRNAEAIHVEWAHRVGDELVMHPKIPALRVVSLVPGHGFVAFGPADEAARAGGKPWAAASWAFLVEPLGEERCRVVSRFRTACSADLATRIAQGPALLEPVGFAMDRRMLIGIRERVIATRSTSALA